MNNDVKKAPTVEQENVLAGTVGAFLFSLVGGALWFIIYLFGFIAGISGLIGAVCAIKGYSLFSKKESTKGIIISVIISLLVIVLAWYFCLAYDVYDAHQLWFQEGEIDFTISFFEAFQISHLYLSDPEIGPAYYKDLIIGLVFCVIGGGSYVINKYRNAKQNAQNEEMKQSFHVHEESAEPASHENNAEEQSKTESEDTTSSDS